MRTFLYRMSADDEFSLVAFDNEVVVQLPSRVTRYSIIDALVFLDKLTARGGLLLIQATTTNPTFMWIVYRHGPDGSDDDCV